MMATGERSAYSMVHRFSASKLLFPSRLNRNATNVICATTMAQSWNYAESWVLRSRSVSQHCHLCAVANHPPLTHSSLCSPSTQVASLTCPEVLIMPVTNRWSCCVYFVNFRRWYAGTLFWAQGASKREPSETRPTHTSIYAHKQR